VSHFPTGLYLFSIASGGPTVQGGSGAHRGPRMRESQIFPPCAPTLAVFSLPHCASIPPAAPRVTVESDGSAWIATWRLAAPARAGRTAA
jgi:hypothetical protein